MCGRFTQTISLADVLAKYSFINLVNTDILGEERFENFNLAPSEVALTLKSDGEGVVISQETFGTYIALGKGGSRKSLLNARVETVLEKPTFSRRVLTSRVVVPINGYFEWKTTTPPKRPYFVHFDGGPIASIAGIELVDRETGEVGVVLVTTEANAEISEVHNRMPLVLSNEIVTSWLDESLKDRDEVAELLELAKRTTKESSLFYYEVDKRVGSPTFKSPMAIAPVEPSTLF
ncbi:MAG: SOS response-associated peptidase [Actinomycetota bacterium]|nr:SOS response-associated peptidase [Actinomycetota bacterium]